MYLVSGATGFAGAYIVCDLLKQNKKVRALKRVNSNLTEFDFIASLTNISEEQKKNLEWWVADILDVGDLELAFAGVTEVIHSAAMVSFLPKDIDKMMLINVTGTANMVNLALEFGIKKFGHISSIAAIGRSETQDHVNEETKWEKSNNNTHYAESKFASEMEVWRGIQEGLNAVIVNPGIILGPGDFSKGSGKMFDSAFHGMKFYTPGINGFVDVRDVSRAIIELMNGNIWNERFILVSENLAYRQFYNEASACFEKPAPIYNTPIWFANFGYRCLALWSFLTQRPPLLTKETTNAAFRKYYYDNSKIKKMTGFEFISIGETITHTCRIFLKSRLKN